MYLLVGLVLEFLEAVVELLVLELFLGPLPLARVELLITKLVVEDRPGRLDNLQHVLAYLILNLERQVLLNEVVGGFHNTEVVVDGETNGFYLLNEFIVTFFEV